MPVPYPPEFRARAIELARQGDKTIEQSPKDRPNRTTVTFDAQNGSIGDNHGMNAYLPTAKALDNSVDPSVTAYRDSSGACLADGATVRANVYQLTRSQ